MFGNSALLIWASVSGGREYGQDTDTQKTWIQFLFVPCFFSFFESPRARQLECLAEMSLPLSCLLASLHLESVKWDRR